MKPSDALEVLAFVRLVWHLPVPADPKDDLDLVLWPNELEYVDYEKAQIAVRRFNSSNYAPTVLQVANVANALAIAGNDLMALPADTRDECCRTAERSFAHWVEDHASPADLQQLGRLSPALRERYGIELADVEDEVKA